MVAQRFRQIRPALPACMRKGSSKVVYALPITPMSAPARDSRASAQPFLPPLRTGRLLLHLNMGRAGRTGVLRSPRPRNVSLLAANGRVKCRLGLASTAGHGGRATLIDKPVRPTTIRTAQSKRSRGRLRGDCGFFCSRWAGTWPGRTSGDFAQQTPIITQWFPSSERMPQANAGQKGLMDRRGVNFK